MSRGIGRAQRATLRVLRETGEALYPREIQREAGIADLANTRRALRSLERRGTIERDDAGRVKLTFIGAAQASFMDRPSEPDPLEELRRERREFDRQMAEVRAEALEKVRLFREEEARWKPPRYERQRHKGPGANEYRVLATLSRCSSDLQKGLPRAAVVRIAQAADPASIRRAIRSLLDRAELQESRDEERIRLRVWYRAFLYEGWWELVDPPLEDAKAVAVLEGFGELRGEGA